MSAGPIAAQSAATSGDQWRTAGSAQPANDSDSSAAAANTIPAWHPNGWTNNGNFQPADDGSNSLRPSHKPQPASLVSEPRAFVAPSNAAPIKTSQSAATTPKIALPQHSSSAAVATPPAPIAKQAYAPTRAPANRVATAMQRPASQPVTWYAPTNSSGVRPSAANSTAGYYGQAVNVAFQGQPAPKKKVATENLPMPRGDDPNLQDPVMRYPNGPNTFFPPADGPYYQPNCDGSPFDDEAGCPAGGCGNGVCEPGCGCPCGAPCGEPGCGCEPRCGSACDACDKDCLCIGPGDDESCHTVKVRVPKWQEVEAFGGVQGFKGPYDRTRDSGNFGFNEGFNIGAKIPYAELGYQFGYRAAESQLNGDKDTGIDKSFLQDFVTAGLFHRQKDGVQFGVAWDALIDERTKAESFNQIRGEISIINCGCHEFGFDATVGLNRKKVDDGTGTQTDHIYQASDQYVLFYRLHGISCGEGRIYAGVNNDSDGILGSDMLLPLSDCFSVQGGFAYLIPNAKNGTEGATQEAWNIGLGLVWNWDHQARKCFSNCYRPMFNVADNGTLIVDQQDK